MPQSECYGQARYGPVNQANSQVAYPAHLTTGAMLTVLLVLHLVTLDT